MKIMAKNSVFVYDQGVGISETLPTTETGKKVLGLFSPELLKLMSNGDKIKSILETPKSRTLLKNRGRVFAKWLRLRTSKTAV